MERKITADSLGLIVPMNIEALCVDERSSREKSFQPAPYDFGLLPKAGDAATPYLSSKIMTGGSKSMSIGIHLHWALPDGLTKGSSRQNGEGNVSFPETPDRWLVTRTFSDLSGMVNRTKSWVVESNYLSAEDPDSRRPSLPVPYSEKETEGNLYRYLGRVLEYETWLTKQQQAANGNSSDDGTYADGLSAVGYGTPTFAASYNTSKNIFGFYDIDKELSALGNDIMLSYHVIGWYHDVDSDPLNQLPLQFNKPEFELLLEKAPDAYKATLSKFYERHQDDGAYVLIKIEPKHKAGILDALLAAGFDRLDYLMNRCKWSLPLMADTTDKNVTHTLYTGIITDVKWNRDKSAFKDLSEQLNVSVGNTASQALAALIAKVSKSTDTENVEMLLDALQLDKLKGISKPGDLNRLEDLAMAIHTSGYTSSSGGQVWEVTKIDDKDSRNNLKGLAKTLGEELNELNNMQLKYDRTVAEIESARTQIFLDWYRFILILRTGTHSEIDINDLLLFIEDEIKALGDREQELDEAAINRKVEEIKKLITDEYELVKTSAARYWQPTEPVVLFQGKDITPPERYGGDGRFMADGTLLCRLSSQLVTRVVIPVDTVGNAVELVFDQNNTPQLPKGIPLDHSAQLYALFAESSMLNPLVMSVLCKASGATSDRGTIADIIEKERDKYLSPAVPEVLSKADMDAMTNVAGANDLKFLASLYKEKDNAYALILPLDKISANDVKRLHYLFVSASLASGSVISFGGVAPSLVYFVKWDGNPWLPYSLTWQVIYYPIAEIKPESGKNTKYDPDFITKNFKLGDAAYEYTGQLSSTTFQAYKNTIFLSPHAEENFQVKIKKFIESQPGAAIDKYLEDLLKKLKDFPPVLSQSLNGLNDEMIMREQVMQLEVKDIVEDPLQDFTNDLVRNAVKKMNTCEPKTSNFYNPIRAGFMRVQELVIVDVFGCKMIPKASTISNIIVAQNLKSNQPEKPIYLEPRISQPGRLQFRWLAAANKTKKLLTETNSHPGTTPVCGWILANHLQPGIWLYTAAGAPIGSLNLTEDLKKVKWQAVPGKSVPGIKIDAFFDSEEGQKINPELKKLALALYNKGEGDYLRDMLRANDRNLTTIKPQNYRQTSSNAVLLGSPIAVAQVSLGIELYGSPAYSNSWKDLKKEVEESVKGRLNNPAGKPVERAENGFTKVKFPVRLGNTSQTEDGLLGYFTEDNYNRYYAIDNPAEVSPSGKVHRSTDKDIQLSIHQSRHETVVTLLLDPRGSIHARTGVLPTKSIDIPASQYAEALENLEVTFLTSPVLYYNDQTVAPENNKPAMPVPGVGGGEWEWVQRELNAWATEQIQPVDDRAKLSDVPHEIREGWLLLTNSKN